MRLMGRTWKCGDNIDTDVIIPARYLDTTDPRELGSHCLEDLNIDLGEKIEPGDILVAGENFGCGSSREHAPIALKAVGLSAIVAKSFARIFYRNAINIGLPVVEVLEAVDHIDEGDIIEVDLAKGTLRNIDKDESYGFHPLPDFILDIVLSGGLVDYIKGKMRSRDA